MNIKNLSKIEKKNSADSTKNQKYQATQTKFSQPIA